MADEMMTVGLGLRFEDTPVGMKFKTIGRTVTEADITMFVGVTGMVEVLFTNMEYLAEESLFAGKRLYSFAEGLLMQTVVQGVGLSFLGMELNVEGPTFAGDTLHVECEVLESRPTKKVGRGIVKTRNRVINQRGECVMTYTPTRLVKGRDYSPKG